MFMLGANAHSLFAVGLCIFTDTSNIFLINNIFSPVKLLFSSFHSLFLEQYLTTEIYTSSFSISERKPELYYERRKPNGSI